MARRAQQSSQHSQQSGSTSGLPSERHEEVDDGSSIVSTVLASAVTPHRAEVGAASVLQPSKKPWTGDSTDIDNVMPVLNNYITTCLFPKVKFLKSDDPLLLFDPQERSLCRMVSLLHCRNEFSLAVWPRDENFFCLPIINQRWCVTVGCSKHSLKILGRLLGNGQRFICERS